MTVTRGHMVLYDRMQPALPADNYRIAATTDVVVVDPGEKPADDREIRESLRPDTRYFDVVGPRFSLAPTELAGVFPPRNGHGDFTLTLPHVAFGRRTLPWENDLDPANVLPQPEASDGGAPALSGIRPSIALLLFEESEITIERAESLEDVLPASVRTAIDAPSGVECDALVVRRSILLDVLPTPDELEALTHVREVNVDDRELAAGDSDGWFSVVMSNRLPEADRTYRACVVSLEGRTDLFEKLEDHLANLPGTVLGTVVATAHTVAQLEHLARRFPEREDIKVRLAEARAAVDVGAEIDAGPTVDAGSAVGARSAGDAAPAGDREVTSDAVTRSSAPPADRVSADAVRVDVAEEVAHWVTVVPLDPLERLVLLASWSFECVGTGTFRTLCQRLDVGMAGDHAPGVQLADSGHVAIQLKDRDGNDQTAWYRGPLAPYPMTRDPEGPYHSADQCRRVSPETGMEDVSFAAAFEVGRLLATSDSRLAQELMRWRRTAYRAARRALARDALAVGFDMNDIRDLTRPLAPMLSARVAERVVGDVPRIDRFEQALVAGAPGLDPAELTRVWRLADPSQAEALLAGSHVDAIGGMPEVIPTEAAEIGHLRDLRGVMMDSIRRNGG